MSRVIKFRGWDKVGNKGWVYGDLVHNQKVTKEGLEPRTMVGGYEVDPESVCQFTGLCDKNGREIYEGDRLCVDCGNGYDFYANVVWNSTYAGFYLDEGAGCFSPLPPSCSAIIGTIFEKQKLCTL